MCLDHHTICEWYIPCILICVFMYEYIYFYTYDMYPACIMYTEHSPSVSQSDNLLLLNAAQYRINILFIFNTIGV